MPLKDFWFYYFNSRRPTDRADNPENDQEDEAEDEQEESNEA